MQTLLRVGCLLWVPTICCTSLIVGKGATLDGSVLASHSDDAASNPDARLILVPAMDHPPESLRQVFFATEDYPRYVGDQRGPGYLPKAGQLPHKPIGTIPQVNHTFQYFDTTYGVMNEYGVGIGETSCSAVFGASAVTQGGKALLCIDELTRIALERCRTARCAVKTMGNLAEIYGFYGATNTPSPEGGESLMVIDADEGFIFHILPDDTGTSAIWVAQRVADTHVGVVSNMFTIRQVNLSDTSTFLASDNVLTIAQQKGWWSPAQGLLDFTRVYSHGEYGRKYYSGRRMWGAYRLLVPDHPLSPNYTNLLTAPYPVTLATSLRLRPQDLFAVHRSFYQGTPYDTTQGLAAGPFGDPDRFGTSSPVDGAWERTIAIYRTDQTHVVQARAGAAGVVWYAPHAPAGSCFVPLLADQPELPVAYTEADPLNLTRASAYWAHRYVAHVVRPRYANMHAAVEQLQQRLEERSVALLAELGRAGVRSEDSHQRLVDNAQDVAAQWWALPDQLVLRFSDGYDNQTNLGYPAWWLAAVGYANGPPPVPSYPPQNQPGGGTSCSVRECVRKCDLSEVAFKSCVQACLVCD